MLTMCGRKHLLMLECCLFSINRFWSRLPRLKVISDGTITTGTIARRLRWWSQEVEVLDWREYLTSRVLNERPELVAFCQRHVLGKKLLALVEEAEQQPIFWCDSDMLFYGDLHAFLPTDLPSGPFVFSAEDVAIGAYDPALLNNGLEYLADRPFVNTGLVLCGGTFYDACALSALVRKGLDKCYGVTEQTILAHAVHQTGKVYWRTDIVEINGSDQYYLTPVGITQGGVARHYVSGYSQHMFWRDALAMRRGLL
jgi:hypothetical protein